MWFFGSKSSEQDKILQLTDSINQLSSRLDSLHRQVNMYHQEIIEKLNSFIMYQPLPSAPLVIPKETKREQEDFMKELGERLCQMRNNMGDSHGF
jgi:hypothetical protein